MSFVRQTFKAPQVKSKIKNIYNQMHYSCYILPVSFLSSIITFSNLENRLVPSYSRICHYHYGKLISVHHLVHNTMLQDQENLLTPASNTAVRKRLRFPQIILTLSTVMLCSFTAIHNEWYPEKWKTYDSHTNGSNPG